MFLTCRKKVDAKSCKKYAKFFKALRSASDFQKLAKIVAYLKEKTYNAQEGVLKEIFQCQPRY